MPDQTNHVYVSRLLTEPAMQRLEELPVPVRTNPDPDWPPSRDELLSAVEGAVGVITLLTEQVNAEFLDAAGSSLQIVANCAVGFDNIDVGEAQRRGITITNTPRVLDEATADLAFGLILAVARRIVEGDRFLRRGEEWIWGPRMFLGLDVSSNATLGIIGLGRIGMAVARRASAFRMRMLASDPNEVSPEAQELGIEQVGVEDLLSVADVVSLHCPLTPDTHHLISTQQLELMKPTAVLVNTARGPLVDEEALVKALEEGTIAGAGLDVFEEEPRLHPRLTQFENVVVTPHIASAGKATRDEMGILAVENVGAVLDGRPALTPV